MKMLRFELVGNRFAVEFTGSHLMISLCMKFTLRNSKIVLIRLGLSVQFVDQFSRVNGLNNWNVMAIVLPQIYLNT